jgi:hypothetical protein
VTALEALSAAEQLAETLRTALLKTKWTWKAAPEVPANVTRKRFGAVWRTKIEPAAQGRLDTHLTLDLYGAKAAPGEATERELDDMLDAVLLVIQGVPGLRFLSADRATFAEAFAGYQVQVSINHNNYYAERIRHLETEGS